MNMIRDKAFNIINISKTSDSVHVSSVDRCMRKTGRAVSKPGITGGGVGAKSLYPPHKRQELSVFFPQKLSN